MTRIGIACGFGGLCLCGELVGFRFELFGLLLRLHSELDLVVRVDFRHHLSDSAGAHALLDILKVLIGRNTSDERLGVFDLNADFGDDDVDDEQRYERSEEHICADTYRTAEYVGEEHDELLREKVKTNYRGRREHYHNAVEDNVAGLAVLGAGHREQNEADKDEHCREQNGHERYKVEQERVPEKARADKLEQCVKVKRRDGIINRYGVDGHVLLEERPPEGDVRKRKHERSYRQYAEYYSDYCEGRPDKRSLESVKLLLEYGVFALCLVGVLEQPLLHSVVDEIDAAVRAGGTPIRNFKMCAALRAISHIVSSKQILLPRNNPSRLCLRTFQLILT